MGKLNAEQLTVFLAALGLLIGMARLLGELARRYQQPAVLGELAAGVLLGPTVFGTLAPTWQATLFPATGPTALALDAIGSLAIVLFLMVAGMEVDLSSVWRQGSTALKVSLLATLVPFAVGLAGGVWFPTALGRQVEADPMIFALFIATAMAISALPVIAKTLMDLNLYRTDLGMVVVSAAILNDLVGWTVFAVILGMIGAGGHSLGIGWTILLTLLFVAFALTAARWAVHRIIPFLQAYTHWPGGELGFAVTLALFGAAFTELIGVHAIFGAFLMGVALGETPHMQERTRVMVDEFVSFIFAPVFFASIGLKVNFLTHFDLQLVLLVLVLACVGKLIGAWVGAYWGGMAVRDRWAVGFAMNARGAMEIILGLLALEAGIIRQRLFVALVVMAIVTSAAGGPLIRMALRRQSPRLLGNLLSPNLFTRRLNDGSRREAVHELVWLAAKHAGLDPIAVEEVVWQREMVLATGLGAGVAIPHGRLPNIKKPIVVVGMSDAGVDFDAPDGLPSRVVILLLTPADDPTVQLDLCSIVARTFRDPLALERVMHAGNYVEFLAALKLMTPSKH